MINRPSDLSEVFFESVPELKEIEAPIKRQNLRHQCSARDIESEYELLRAITASKKHKLLLRTNGVFENKLNRYAELEICMHCRLRR